MPARRSRQSAVSRWVKRTVWFGICRRAYRSPRARDRRATAWGLVPGEEPFVVAVVAKSEVRVAG